MMNSKNTETSSHANLRLTKTVKVEGMLISSSQVWRMLIKQLRLCKIKSSKERRLRLTSTRRRRTETLKQVLSLTIYSLRTYQKALMMLS